MPTTSNLSRPELPGQDNYEQALRIALEAFGRKDPAKIAQNAGASLDGSILTISHLTRQINIDLITHHVSIKPENRQAPTWLAILVFHYLNNADGRIPTGRLKHFREFKDGLFYESAFNRRTRDILIGEFSSEPARMVHAGKKLGAKVLDIGEYAVELRFLPHFPLTCILWSGCEDFPSEAGVLFDETADLFFCAEDMAVAGQMAVVELLNAARSQGL